MSYRIDNFVNRVAYDRMIESLQLFLNDDTSLVSKQIRDLLLYSYPGTNPVLTQY